MSAKPDPHAELGVPPNASAAEVHRAFRRRLREHHPDTRSQQDGPSNSASDQALQRALAAYQALRQQVTTPQVETPAEGERPRAEPQEPPFAVTAVHWVPAAGTGPGPYRPRSRTSHVVSWPDWLSWLLDQ
jgi:DnaJ domain